MEKAEEFLTAHVGKGRVVEADDPGEELAGQEDAGIGGRDADGGVQEGHGDAVFVEIEVVYEGVVPAEGRDVKAGDDGADEGVGRLFQAEGGGGEEGVEGG